LPKRHAGTKVVLGAALILLMCTGVVVAYVPVDSMLAGRASSATTTPSRLVSQVSASAPTQTATPSASPTFAEPLVTPAPTATPAIPTPPPPTPTPTRTPRPTPVPYREYRVPILMYHRIVPPSESGQEPNGLLIPPEIFTAQMRALYEAGWRTITLGELAQDMQDGTPPPARAFVITIDDGWWDGYTYAYPIMHEYGFVATYFVISSRIDQKDNLSSGQLQDLVATGNEIGNHTENHVSLQTVNLARAKSEVGNASDRIAEVTGIRPVSLSYPMGGINQVALLAVSECPDLKIAVTEGWGVTESWLNRFNSPRVRVNPTTRPDRLVADLTAWVGL
jgi:peptidoglycan/xylan/chitin deacetylase (PgdA/CDA1 family)